MKVEAVVDAGDDRLIVRGLSDDGETIHAYGWVSAITNHTDDERPEGKPAVNWTSREMTDTEKMAYYEYLLNEQNPRLTLKNLL